MHDSVVLKNPSIVEIIAKIIFYVSGLSYSKFATAEHE